MIKNRLPQDDDGDARRAAVRAIAEHSKDDPDTLPLLKDRVQQDDNGDVRQAAFGAIGNGWIEEPGILIFLLRRCLMDVALRPEELKDKPAQEILEKLIEAEPDDADKILQAIANEHEDETLRNWAIQKLVTRNSLENTGELSE